MGGDCTGKMLIPIIADGNGGWRSSWAGEEAHLADEVELEEYEKRVKNTGYYPARISESWPDSWTRSRCRSALFSRTMCDTLERWTKLAEQRFAGSDVHVIMTPGNDDEFDVDEVLRRSSFIDAAEDA